MTAAQTCAALAAHGVDLVDEDDGGGAFLGLLEQVTHAGSTHAHIQLHKVGAGDGQILTPCFPGHSAGQQGLTGTRRAHEQHALGDAGAQLGVLGGLAQEVHDLSQLFLFLVGPGHVVEGDGAARLGQGAGLGLAELAGGGAAPAALGPAQEQEIPQDGHHGQHHHPGQDGAHPGRRGAVGVVIAAEDAALILFDNEIIEVVVKQLEVVNGVDNDTAAVHRFFQGDGQVVVVIYGEAVDLFLLEQRADVRVHPVRLLVGRGRAVNAGPAEDQGHHEQHQDQTAKGICVWFQMELTPLRGRGSPAPGSRPRGEGGYSYTLGFRTPM